MLPIPEQGRVKSIHGLESARCVPGIRDVILTVGPGDLILPFPEQSCYIGFLTASGVSVEETTHSLELSAGKIGLELEPLQCENWTRDIRDHASFWPSRSAEVHLLDQYSQEEARAIVLPLIAAAHFLEYPYDEALKKANECLEWIESGSRGETAPSLWMTYSNHGVALGSANGETCYISCLGVPASHRRLGIGTTLVRSMMGLFAHRGCSKMQVLLDPCYPAPRVLYQELGFRPEVCPEQTCCCG